MARLFFSSCGDGHLHMMDTRDSHDASSPCDNLIGRALVVDAGRRLPHQGH